MASHPLRGAAAIVGLGITPQGKVYGNTPLGFAVDAVRLALEDAGLGRDDLDGVLLNPGLAWNDLGPPRAILGPARAAHGGGPTRTRRPRSPSRRWVPGTVPARAWSWRPSISSTAVSSRTAGWP